MSRAPRHPPQSLSLCPEPGALSWGGLHPGPPTEATAFVRVQATTTWYPKRARVERGGRQTDVPGPSSPSQFVVSLPRARGSVMGRASPRATDGGHSIRMCAGNHHLVPQRARVERGGCPTDVPGPLSPSQFVVSLPRARGSVMGRASPWVTDGGHSVRTFTTAQRSLMILLQVNLGKPCYDFYCLLNDQVPTRAVHCFRDTRSPGLHLGPSGTLARRERVWVMLLRSPTIEQGLDTPHLLSMGKAVTRPREREQRPDTPMPSAVSKVSR